MGVSAVGLPNIYKLVNRQTGEEWSPARQAEIMRKGASLRKYFDTICTLYPYHSGQIELGGFCGWEPRQKLTFPDSNDKPLYFGDVVIAVGATGEIRELAILEWQQNIISPKHIGGRGAGPKSKWYFVGNNCEPKEKWAERAKALFPDAEFPPLLEGAEP